MKKYIVAMLLIIFVLMSQPAPAAQIDFNVWYGFWFNESGGPWVISHDDQHPVEFKFLLKSPGILQVTDAYWAGDQFLIYDHKDQIGTTSPVAVDQSIWTESPDEAFADPRWSSFATLLPGKPDHYKISGLAAASPWGYGIGYLRVIPAAPLPSAAMLLLVPCVIVVWRYKGR